jgi:rhodanese-related sulfurtransferase
VRKGGAGSVIDVRSGVEYDSEHVPGCVHVPLGELAARADEVRAAPAPRLLLCRSGPRATSARAILAGLGLGGLSVVEGGLEAYRAAGGATVAGPRRMSLERQVRIVAGALVVLGTALGVWVHPAALAIPAFVGAGQVFAGLTDRCGMGRLLASMPWNRASGASESVVPPSCAASCDAGPVEVESPVAR